jgi:hypothetical protein
MQNMSWLRVQHKDPGMVSDWPSAALIFILKHSCCDASVERSAGLGLDDEDHTCTDEICESLALQRSD